jgi:hypothetical protein
MVLIGVLMSIVVLNATCTDEQKAKMIQQNIAVETIEKICATSQKQTNVIKQTQVLGLKKEPKSEEKIEIQNDELANQKKYGNFRIGVGQTEIGDYSQVSGNIGYHYFPNGVATNSIGFGASFTSAISKEEIDTGESTWFGDPTIEYYVRTLEVELLYSHKMSKGSLDFALITGKFYVDFYGTSDYVPDNISESMNGVGVYYNFGKKMQYSLFYKILSPEKAEDDANIYGLQVVW